MILNVRGLNNSIINREVRKTKIAVRIKADGINGLKKIVEQIKEIEKVNPHMAIDIEVDCQKKLFLFPNFK